MAVALSRGRKRTFQRRVLAWYAVHGRDLPWRHTRDPYAILVSEIMLHQTQVRTVIPYYRRFLQRYPTVQALARARLGTVKRMTDPLGYKVRGSWLKAIATHVAEERAGYFPDTVEGLRRLPGVGPYTAGAVMSFAFHRDAPIVDTNVARLLGRYFAVPIDAQGPHRRRLWELARWVIPRGRAATFNQALMDVGAVVCVARKPRCGACHLRRGCAWRARHAPAAHEPGISPV
jgi:A/G-specific adenine glycosylase